MVLSNRILTLFKTNSNKRVNKFLTQILEWHLKMESKWTSTTFNFNNKSKYKMNKIINCKISSNSSSSLTSRIKFINRINPIFRLFKAIRCTRNNEPIFKSTMCSKIINLKQGKQMETDWCVKWNWFVIFWLNYWLYTRCCHIPYRY